MKLTTSFLIILFILSVICISCNKVQTEINVNPENKAEVFEGIGALSAGASSRLLIDYPEPYRSQILDLLFKPKFGASLHHLKIEIGGDVNSTCGSEPGFAHTKEEFYSPKSEYYSRGYEFWLLTEAYKRNHAMIFDALQWGAPAWIGNGNFYSQDNIDFLIRFIESSKKFHGIDIHYIGIWNERHFLKDYPLNKDYAIRLKQELLKKNLKTQLVGFDEAMAINCSEYVANDSALNNAIDIIGSHYIYQTEGTYKKELIQKSRKLLWASEDGPWRGDWTGAKDIAKRFNRNYINYRMTKTIIWSLITSYYDILPLPGSGLMKANEPWSGHFEVQPALWTCAHFTQFTTPGWYYLPDGCGYSADKSSSFTTLLAPDGKDISMIVETSDAKENQNIKINLSNAFKNRILYFWKSDSLKQFYLTDQITVKGGDISYQFDKESIYTISTTTGQNNGGENLKPPPSLSFQLPYSDNFEEYPDETLPKYTQDQAGAFEVNTVNGKKVLKQSVPSIGIEWHFHLNPEPYTILGDMNLKDYEIGVDFMFNDNNGSASVFGRITKVSQQTVEPPMSYWTRIEADGKWIAGKTEEFLLRNHIDIDKYWPDARSFFPDQTCNFRIFTYQEIIQFDQNILEELKGVETLLKEDPSAKTLRMMLSFDGNFMVYREQHLMEGITTFSRKNWNRLQMAFNGNKISASLNDKKIYELEDDTFTNGLAGFGSGWHEAYFDDLKILPVQINTSLAVTVYNIKNWMRIKS